MAGELGVCCKGRSVLEPYFIRINDDEIEVVQNEIVLHSAKLILNKACSNFENFRRDVQPNSSIEIPVNGDVVFLGILPSFVPQADWNDRNIEFILGSEYKKINEQLTASKEYVINLNDINSINTCSYTPILTLNKIYDTEEVFISIVDIYGNNIKFNFEDYKISFNDKLEGNGKYCITINQTELVNGKPMLTSKRVVMLNVIKNKLLTYDYQDINAYDIGVTEPIYFYDIDNEFKIHIKDIPKTIGLEDIIVEFSGKNKITANKKKLTKDSDGKYNLEISVDIVGYLDAYVDYEFNISNLKNVFDNSSVPNKIAKFKTSFIHSAKTTIDIAELFMLSSNKNNENLDCLYFINNTPNPISLSGIIGYSTSDVEETIKNTKIC